MRGFSSRSVRRFSSEKSIFRSVSLKWWWKLPPRQYLHFKIWPFNSNRRCFIYYSWSTPTATKLEFSNKDTVMHDFRKYSYPYKGQKRTENSPFYSDFSCNKELVWGNHYRNWWRVCYNLYFCKPSQSSIMFVTSFFIAENRKKISRNHIFIFFPFLRNET